jgi:RND superfamily putative drug exporter
LARTSARHPWKTIGIWILLLVFAVALQAGVGTRSNEDAEFTNSPESEVASSLLTEHSDEQPIVETIVFRSAELTVDSEAYRAAVESTRSELLAMTEVVSSATSYYQRLDAGDAGAEAMVSKDGHTTLLSVQIAPGDHLDQAKEFVATAQAQRGNGFEVYAVGDLSGEDVYGAIAEEDLSKAETVGLPVALIVLLVVFGALIAPAIPLLLGIISIIVAVGLTAIVSRIFTITDQVMVMTTMIGLAVGIDYALFMVERYREERKIGLPKIEAIEFAAATAGKAILFSGGTVILALMGMFLIPLTVFHSLAAGAILAVLVAVVATQTFVPAVLRLLGDSINFPRRTRAGSMAGGVRRFAPKGVWGRVARLTMQHPVASLVFSLVVLLGAALPAVTLKTGAPGIDTLPETDVRTGYMILREEFYEGMIAPVEIVIDGSPDEAWVGSGVSALSTALAKDSIFGPAEISGSDDGELTLVSVPLGADGSSDEAFDAIDRLRDSIVPAAFGPHASKVHVGGDSALNHDFNTILSEFTPRVFAFVLGLSFLLLMFAFRSLIVPLKAIVMNLLSVGAAYGTMVAVFQHGIGDETLGMQQAPVIAAWIPIFLFCVLFGLSMDYHVFLLSRIREHFDLTHNNDESVAVGLQATGKIITGAALIMVAVFGSFASGRLVEMQQMGLGLAVAVFLDATIVRTILVPSAMKLLGNANWYLPRWLRWLPDLRIEGSRDVIGDFSPAPAD